ncbi:MAG: FmdE, Molybdenum formylmethanofuran dehydrogenase operon [Methanocella sp. PtaU1.Bin125]|nr:MAG: FmdE, Molybdenum formylmethanofuran dehydrogenase operon [Methanocella sp. PtaU1.Bin125]
MDTPWECEMKATFAALEDRHRLDGRIRRFVDEAVRFHGFPAPGVILGAYMIDLALEKLEAEPGERFFAVAETKKCLSDSIGILTGCTPGSSKFLLFNTGRLSLAIGRDDGSGIAKCVRAFVVPGRTEGYPALRAWYFNDTAFGAKNKLPQLLEEILGAGRSILSWERVEVPIPSKDDQWKPVICPGCGEMVPDYLLEDGLCKACGKGSCYTKHDS